MKNALATGQHFLASDVSVTLAREECGQKEPRATTEPRELFLLWPVTSFFLLAPVVTTGGKSSDPL
jgi:hypothetical protein